MEDVWHDRRSINAEGYNSLTSSLTSLRNKLVSLVTFVVENVANSAADCLSSHDQNLGTISSWVIHAINQLERRELERRQRDLEKEGRSEELWFEDQALEVEITRWSFFSISEDNSLAAEDWRKEETEQFENSFLLWAESPSLWVSDTNALDLQNLRSAIRTRHGRRRELEHGVFTIVDKHYFASKLSGKTWLRGFSDWYFELFKNSASPHRLGTHYFIRQPYQ